MTGRTHITGALVALFLTVLGTALMGVVHGGAVEADTGFPPNVEFLMEFTGWDGKGAFMPPEDVQPGSPLYELLGGTPTCQIPTSLFPQHLISEGVYTAILDPDWKDVITPGGVESYRCSADLSDGVATVFIVDIVDGQDVVTVEERNVLVDGLPSKAQRVKGTDPLHPCFPSGEWEGFTSEIKSGNARLTPSGSLTINCSYKSKPSN